MHTTKPIRIGAPMEADAAKSATVSPSADSGQGRQGLLSVRASRHDLAPRTFGEAIEFAKMISQSAFVPREFRGKPGEILAAIQYGFEIGVGPMQALQNIAVINGKPSVYGDLALALVQASGLLEDHKETDDGTTATCMVKRRGDSTSHVVTFSMADAKLAGLSGKQGPWQTHTKRMRQMRARGFALRDKFADVLKGVITREEAEDYPTSDEMGQADNRASLDVTPKTVAEYVERDTAAESPPDDDDLGFKASEDDPPAPVLLNENQVKELKNLCDEIRGFPQGEELMDRAMKRWSLKYLNDMKVADFDRRKKWLHDTLELHKRLTTKAEADDA